MPPQWLSCLELCIRIAFLLCCVSAQVPEFNLYMKQFRKLLMPGLSSSFPWPFLPLPNITQISQKILVSSKVNPRYNFSLLGIFLANCT